MQAIIEVQADAVPSFIDWIARERLDTVRVARCTLPGPSEQMGADVQTLELFLSPVVLTAVATSITVWLRSRTSHVRIRIRTATRDIEVNSSHTPDTEQLIREALRLSSETEPNQGD
ncbi:effector-associated constant component EACC1 [Kineosporia babensis]|uniref:Uncharacterized protein n=1 Tax=Kineosporia babensis TaxID=499548 RepID=A0A9X1NN24_9ACTN|nr:hypothetical protein [Kineosporia babensis]